MAFLFHPHDRINCRPSSNTDELRSLCAQLLGKTDGRFLEIAFKILRDQLGLNPVLTPAQFFERVRTNSGRSDQRSAYTVYAAASHVRLATLPDFTDEPSKCRALQNGRSYCCTMCCITAGSDTRLPCAGNVWQPSHHCRSAAFATLLITSHSACRLGPN